MLEKSSNPIFSKAFAPSYATTNQGVMTLQGTINKSLLSLAIIIVSASLTWNMVQAGNSSAMGLMLGGAILGFITALVTMFKKEWAPITVPLYAIFEGLFLGGISSFIEMAFLASKEPGVASSSNGIVFNAVALTFGVFLLMLLLYKNQIIKPTQKFMLIVTAATGAIFLLYMVNLIMGFFGSNLPFLHSSGPLGIGISLVIVVVAALNLIIDFKQIEDGVAQGAPKFMEWIGAFGLMVTLIWLYIEILNLLMKLRD